MHPGKGKHEASEIMRKMNVPLMAETDDNKVDNSLVPDNAVFRMNYSVPTSSLKRADRRITRSWKKKQD